MFPSIKSLERHATGRTMRAVIATATSSLQGAADDAVVSSVVRNHTTKFVSARENRLSTCEGGSNIGQLRCMRHALLLFLPSSTFTSTSTSSSAALMHSARHVHNSSPTTTAAAADGDGGDGKARSGTHSTEEVDILSEMLSVDADVAATATSASTSTQGHEAAPIQQQQEHQERLKDDEGVLRVRLLRLHNLPKNWLHEDVIQFINQVAEHAGITLPDEQDTWQAQKVEEDEEEDSAIPRATSPFVEYLRVPYGRRTGLVYGTPELHLTSPALADYLLKDLSFDPDDYRNRIYFTEIEDEDATTEGGGNEADGGRHHSQQRRRRQYYVDVEETIETEQQQALQSLELDRFLLAPDLLLDIAKMHQRRLVTRSDKVVLEAFVDGEEDGTDADGVDGSELKRGTTQIKNKGKKKRIGARRAGTQSHLGRGSMQNVPLPQPYVQGRSL